MPETWPMIHKDTWAGGVVPNVVDMDAYRSTFTWEAAREQLDGLPDGRGLNIAHEAVDRHAGELGSDGRPKVAFRFVRSDGSVHELTYESLSEQTSRFANALDALGVGAGDRVFSLLGRRPELYVAALGTFKHRSVFSPLFASFGPEPIRQRITQGDGKVLVTTAALYRRKVASIRAELPSLEHLILVGDGVDEVVGAAAFDQLLADQDGRYEIGPTDPEDPALLHFTSGTTGTPKGAVHVHQAVVAHHATGFTALDLHADDTYWCTADPGWVTGMSYGIIAPLVHGVTSIVDEGDFEADRWYGVLEAQAVSVWYTAPTALRMLMRAGEDVARPHDLSRLRFVASVGEPLSPDAVVWGRDVLGLPVHDNWWQTETGGIMIANVAGSDIRPGSMGRPLPGVEAAILVTGDDGRAVISDGQAELVTEPGTVGELALKPGWPSMFRSYLHASERYEKCFGGGWYLTGDLASIDEDGWFWFVGRADDVIKAAGHLIGPVEVERVLLEHDAVADVAVIGVPDPVAGQRILAFVTLSPGHEPDDACRRDLIGFGRKRLGPAVAPKEIVFDQQLPHTTSGKVMRRMLKARYLGGPEGDTSTLGPAPAGGGQ